MTVLLRARNAAFGYERSPVVTGVDLEVHAGHFIGVMGPNGAGKTTFFRGLLGLLPPMEGSVERLATAVGYVPQRETLDAINPLTVEEVVLMGAFGRLRGTRRVRRTDRKLALECLERVGLAHRRRELFASLSGGQRQRALIARALMVRPQLMLLDEPTSGVDATAVERILDLLRELRERERIAILIVTHQLELLRRAVDEILWVAGGTVKRIPVDPSGGDDALERLFSSVADGAG